jgi:hypothetical protein
MPHCLDVVTIVVVVIIIMHSSQKAICLLRFKKEKAHVGESKKLKVK